MGIEQSITIIGAVRVDAAAIDILAAGAQGGASGTIVIIAILTKGAPTVLDTAAVAPAPKH
jgi:hypothetical protein